MNGFSDWFDTNGLDLARLMVQIGIFAAMVIYSRKILRVLIASQQQIGALLRLSVSDGATHERANSMAEPAMTPPGFSAPAYAEKHAEREEPSAAIPSMIPAPSFSARTTPVVPDREQSLGGRVVAERIAVREPEPEPAAPTPWVAAPNFGDTERAEGFAAKMADSTRNLGRWLNEPPRRSHNGGGNPLRRLIRWLQAPAGSNRASLS